MDFSYNKSVHALRDVTMDISQNQVFGLLGANGSGKSTLIHCLCGFLHPQGGQAVFAGTNLFSTSRTQHLNLVFQKDIFWPNLTVWEHLQIFSAMHQNENLDQIIQSLELQQCLGQRASQLSEGLKRKMSIAIALTAMPKFLILDEPSCGLGMHTKNIVHRAILSILTNSTIIITTHDMNEVEKLVDRCVIMKDGQVVSHGEIHNFIQQAGYQITLDASEQQIQQLELKVEVQQKQFNQQTQLRQLQIKPTMEQFDVIQILHDLQLEGSVDQARMEQVFMEFCQ